MNTYEWMTTTDSGNEPPLHEDDTREDPGHRPQVPVEDTDTTREHHGNPDQQAEPHEPFRSIEDPTEQVSNEGIVESVRKLFGIHNRGKKFVELDGNAGASIGKIYKTIEDTFASKEWLDKQTPVKGTVKVDDLLQNIDPKNLVACVQETFAINLAFAQAVDKAQLTVLETLGPVLRQWKPRNLTDKVFDATMKVLGNVSPVNELVKKPTRTRTNLLPSKGEPTTPPLSIDSILELATAINKCMRTDVNRIDNQGDSLDKGMGSFSEAYDGISNQDDHSESYNTQAWEKLAGRVFDKLSPNGVQEALAAMRQFSTTCIDCVIYMERSIKGGKVTVSNEGIFDAIKGLFAKKPEIMEIKWVDHEIGPEFDKTLFNQQWLDKQTFTEGEVSIKFPKVATNGAYEPLSKEILAELSKVGAQNAKLGKAYYGKTKPAYDAMNINIGDRSIAEIQKLRDIVNYEDMDFVVKWVEPKTLTEPEVTMELPALDSAGVQKAAKMIITLVTALQAYNREAISGVPKYPKPAWRVLVTHIKDESKIPLIREYHEDLESIADYGVESFFQRTGVQWDVVENLTYGLMRWIAKSVTGISFEK